MNSRNLLPYETIKRAAEGEPEAVDTVLQFYSHRIRYATLENGHLNTDTDTLSLHFPVSAHITALYVSLHPSSSRISFMASAKS